jgi:ZIP family zinc transporter
MPHNVLIAFGACILAALATILGAGVLFNIRKPHPRLLAFGLAFAGGAMVYVSLVEIFVKSQIAFGHTMIDKQGYAYATMAFFCGVLMVMLLDRLLPNPHEGFNGDDHHGHDHDHKHVARVGLMAALAITAHNFPEGMATFFATLDDPRVGAPLAAAIAIHNIPEGVSIAIPVYYATGSKAKAIIACSISAVAEPIGAALGYFILQPYLSQSVYGWVFGIIAGIMVFLALDELLPAAKRYARGHETVYGMVGGMAALALSLVLFR